MGTIHNQMEIAVAIRETETSIVALIPYHHLTGTRSCNRMYHRDAIVKSAIRAYRDRRVYQNILARK